MNYLKKLIDIVKKWYDIGIKSITKATSPIQEEKSVEGDKQGWVKRCYVALEAAGFKDITFNQMLFRLSAKYKKMQAQGSMQIMISSNLNHNTTIHISVTGGGIFNARARYILEEFTKQMNWSAVVEGIDFQEGDTAFLASMPTTTTVAGGSEGFFLRFMNCGCGIIVIVVVLIIFALLTAL